MDWKRDEELEAAADALLEVAEPDREYPAYS